MCIRTNIIKKKKQKQKQKHTYVYVFSSCRFWFLCSFHCSIFFFLGLFFFLKKKKNYSAILACVCLNTQNAIYTNADSSGAHRLYIYIEREREKEEFFFCIVVSSGFSPFFFLFISTIYSVYLLLVIASKRYTHSLAFVFFLRSRWLSTVFSAFDLFVHSFFFFRQLFPFSSSKYSRECLKKKKNVLLIFFFAAATCDCVSSLCYFREEKRATKIRRPHADDFLLSVLRQWY